MSHQSREELQNSNVMPSRPYFEIAADFNVLAHEYIAGFEKAKEQPVGVALAMLARGTNSLQGAVVLCELGLTAEANSLVRAAFECCFALGALCKGYPLVAKLQEAHEKARNQWAKFQLENSGQSRLNDEQLAILRAQATDSAGGNSLNYWTMAQQAGLLEYYETMYRPLSNFGTHLSEGSLSALLEPIENNVSHVRMAMHGALTAYVLLLREASRFHPVESINVDVGHATQRFSDLASIHSDCAPEGDI